MTNTLIFPAKLDQQKEIKDLLTKSENAIRGNLDEAMGYAQKALSLVSEDTSPERKCYLYYTLSKIYCLKGNYQLASNYASHGKMLCKKHSISPFLQHKIYNINGVIYQGLGEYVKSSVNYLEAIEVLNDFKESYRKEIAGVYMNMAVIAYRLKNFAESLDALSDATRYMKEADSQMGLIQCYNTYGNVYNDMNEIENAEIYYHQSLMISKEIGVLQYQAAAYNNLSFIAEKRKNYTKALSLVNKSLKINEELNRAAIIAIDYRRIGIISFELGEIDNGIEHLVNSYELSKKLENHSETVITLNNLAEYCAKAQRWEEAYQYRTMQNDMKGQIFDDEKVRVLSEMQVKHQVERKRRETEILKASEERIREYAEKLEESNQELERFAHVASHDMKEPLRMIKSYLSLIKRKVDKMGDETLSEFLYFAVDGADRMEKLISEMLKLARVQTKEHKMEEVDLNDVMFVVQNNIRTALAERNVQLQVNRLPVVRGNMALLSQLLQNLITNGIKYNRSETPIIRINSFETEDAYQIEVIDNGIGIQDEYFEKVFEMLTRLHNRTEFEGTGIGLATCKRIVERHKGKIWVSSEYGKGSNFQFYIPKYSVN